MKIKAQDGKIYEAYNLEMNYCTIKCDDVKDRRKKHVPVFKGICDALPQNIIKSSDFTHFRRPPRDFPLLCSPPAALRGQTRSGSRSAQAAFRDLPSESLLFW